MSNKCETVPVSEICDCGKRRKYWQPDSISSCGPCFEYRREKALEEFDEEMRREEEAEGEED